MTDKIREKYIRRVADEITSVHNYDKSPLEIASSILSIKGIRIEAGNQKLPRNPEPDPPNDHDEVIAHAAYGSAQQDMLTPKDGNVWVKCGKEEQ